MRLILAALTSALLVGGVFPAHAAPEPYALTLTLKDHRFIPDSVEVPAGVLIRIELVNQDAATEEFDSEDLRVEKDVTPNGKISFVVGPLSPGTYSFTGELHADTASGTIKAVARAAPTP